MAARRPYCRQLQWNKWKMMAWTRDVTGVWGEVVRYGICLKVKAEVAGLAPAWVAECRRRGNKDESEVGISNRGKGTLVTCRGTLGKKQTCPAEGVQFGVSND